MKKYIAIVSKEFLQIVRDLPGLALLFLLPATMLIIITLTQEKQIIGMDSGMKIALVNADSSILGNTIEKELNDIDNFRCRVFDSKEEAESAVVRGEYQIMMLVPQGATERIRDMALKQACDTNVIKPEEMKSLSGIILLYDPAVMKIYTDMLVSSLQMIVKSTIAKLYSGHYSAAVMTNINEQFESYQKKLTDIDLEKEMPDFPGKQQVIKQIQDGFEKKAREPLRISLPDYQPESHELIEIEVKMAGNQIRMTRHNIVNNNVPAFILFAMFFIVVPLAGSILSEKQLGTRDRLMTLPVTKLIFFSGKITVYLVVCILQFILMALIGKYVFPLISNLPGLSLHVNGWALALTVFASSLAAIGFGLVIGSVCSTFGQAAPIGSVLVVIFAILGGIFVPNYMMPELISKISVISPMRWGTDAFFSIFARGAGIDLVISQLLSLLAFFVISLFVSVYTFAKRK
ncbi:MAG: ABC transporter permease [Bacteroidales bacterium]|nr:ABC transporter permease [Bacteroidales bacterium]